MKHIFKSQTYGKDLTLEEVIKIIEKIIVSEPSESFVLAVGTDSQNKKRTTVFTSAIVLHKVGKGGIFFYEREKRDRIKVRNLRLLEEANLTIELGRKIVEQIETDYLADSFDLDKADFKLEIHCDYGNNGASNEVLREAIGWISASFIGSNIAVKVKPDAYAASYVADSKVKE